MAERVKVAVVYPYLPHYRIPVFKELCRAEINYEFVFFYGKNTIDRTVRSCDDKCEEIVSRNTRGFSVLRFFIQRDVLHIALGREFAVIILLGNPYHLSTWVLAFFGRIMGKKIVFWTHGWIKPEKGARRLLRAMYYSLADSLFVYGLRAKELSLVNGTRPTKVHVIYNSLAYDELRKARQTAERLPVSRDPRCIVYIGRLKPAVELDVLVRAAALVLKVKSKKLRLLFIGSGPCVEELKALAVEENVDLTIISETYEEENIARYLMEAQILVAPGQVGLSAIHALSYGIPVLTHGCFDRQMPEVEAIKAGETGDFFEAGNVDDLAFLLDKWCGYELADAKRHSAIAMIEKYYTPARQVDFIEQGIDKMLLGGAS